MTSATRGGCFAALNPSYELATPLSPHTQRNIELAQRRDDGERRDPAGPGVFRWDVFDRKRKPRRIRIDLDGMAVSRHGGIGPYLDCGAIRTDAGQRQRRDDVDVLREACSGLAGSAGKYPFGGVEPLDRNTVLDEVGRAREAAWRLAGGHAD